MANGTTRTGVLLGQTDFDATLLENGKYVLLSREGETYREKPLTPKADWRSYDGDLNGNRFSQLEQINTTNVGKLEVAWTYDTQDAAAASELEQPFVAEQTQGSEHGVGVDAEDDGEVFGGRQALSGFRLAVCDRAPDLLPQRRDRRVRARRRER